MTNLIIALNTGIVDLEYGASGSEWEEFSVGNDYLLFSEGSADVIDGGSIPSSSKLTQASTILNGTSKIVSKSFLADISEAQLKEIHLMGNTNAQYIMAFDFDDVTGTEPTLEIWDDDNLNTYNNLSLGGGIASNSWWRGITTTDNPSAVDWTGVKLAGNGIGNILYLNNENGALSSAKTLYCNLKIVIPASVVVGGAETPVMVIKYTSN